MAHVAMLNGIPWLVLRAISDEIHFNPENRLGAQEQRPPTEEDEPSDLRHGISMAAERASQLASRMAKYLC